MPMNKANYPVDWKQISLRIRERDGHKCKVCGVPNYAEIVRSREDLERYIIFDTENAVYTYPNGQWIRMSEIPDEYDIERTVKVVLTVAHLNHDTTDNADENLAALCQLHHLRHDKEHHAQNAKRTRLAKRERAIAATGQTSMFEV